MFMSSITPEHADTVELHLLWCLQDSFLYEFPPACNPKDLPKMAPSHEMGMKRMRQEQHNRGSGR